MRWPEAANMALVNAGAAGGRPISPTPVGSSSPIQDVRLEQARKRSDTGQRVVVEIALLDLAVSGS